jgi:hypothetical protein
MVATLAWSVHENFRRARAIPSNLASRHVSNRTVGRHSIFYSSIMSNLPPKSTSSRPVLLNMSTRTTFIWRSDRRIG